MSEFSVLCGLHGEVLEVGGECSVCTLVERNRLRDSLLEIVQNEAFCYDNHPTVSRSIAVDALIKK